MGRKVFYSFHYDNDNWRVATLRSIGAIEQNPIASSNKWEEVKRGGDKSIKNWINENMVNRSCLILLIGSATFGRKWINYEIEKAWNEGKGIVPIYIHNLKNSLGYQSSKGKNPLSHFKLNSKDLSTIVKSYEPQYTDSKEIYSYISRNLSNWIEDAIIFRKSF